MSKLMCPHCGWEYDPDEYVGKPGVQYSPHALVPPHAEAGEPCLGTEQGPRNPESDRRQLWNGEPSPLERDRAARLKPPAPPPCESCARLREANARLASACRLALARIESDIESYSRRTSEGDATRAALAAADPPTAGETPASAGDQPAK